MSSEIKKWRPEDENNAFNRGLTLDVCLARLEDLDWKIAVETEQRRLPLLIASRDWFTKQLPGLQRQAARRGWMRVLRDPAGR